jgi:hypothetical protein
MELSLFGAAFFAGIAVISSQGIMDSLHQVKHPGFGAVAAFFDLFSGWWTSLGGSAPSFYL